MKYLANLFNATKKKLLQNETSLNCFDRLQEAIQNDRHTISQKEEEIRNLRSQVENLKEIRKGLENEEKRWAVETT